jgi:outer membrane immunogenic protein
MKKLVLSAVALLAAGPVVAGGLAPVPADPVVPVAVVPVSVDGDWSGPSLGFSIGRADASTDLGDGQGMTYGLRGGYDYDFGNFVLGGAASYDWSDVDLEGGDQLDSIGRLGIRGGADLGNTLVYATGGAAFAQATVAGEEGSDTGWFAGIGAEHRLNGGNWTVGAEVLTNRFSDFEGTGVDLEATTIGLNVGMRF